MQLEIRLFHPSDQESVRELVLAGLADHWEIIDPGLNPDLTDIAAAYAGEIFLVACMDGRIAGCGALVRKDNITGEIVRVSVDRGLRGRGIGRQIVSALTGEARRSGMRRLVLETTAGWQYVRSFYEALGFTYTHFQGDEFGGQAHYELRVS